MSVPRRPEAADAPLGVRAARRPRRARPSGIGSDHELRDPHPRLDDERLARVGVEQLDQQLAAVAGVDEARACSRSRSRASRRGPSAAGRSPRSPPGSRPRGRSGRARALAGRELDALARREVEAGVARVRARREHGLVAQPPDRQLDQAVSRCARRRPGTARTGGARGAAGARRRARRPACPRAARSARRARTAPRGGRPRRTGGAAAPAPSGARTARRSAPSAPRAPRRSRPTPAARPGSGSSSRRRPISSTRSILFSTSCTGSSRGADLVEHLLDRGDHRVELRRRAAEASATCSTMSATSVSSSVAAKPSTS